MGRSVTPLTRENAVQTRHDVGVGITSHHLHLRSSWSRSAQCPRRRVGSRSQSRRRGESRRELVVTHHAPAVLALRKSRARRSLAASTRVGSCSRASSSLSIAVMAADVIGARLRDAALDRERSRANRDPDHSVLDQQVHRRGDAERDAEQDAPRQSVRVPPCCCRRFIGTQPMADQLRHDERRLPQSHAGPWSFSAMRHAASGSRRCGEWRPSRRDRRVPRARRWWRS